MKKGQNVVVISGKLKGVRGKFVAKTFVKFKTESGKNRALIEANTGEKMWVDLDALSTRYSDFQSTPRRGGDLPLYLDAGFTVTKLPPAQGQYY